MRTLTVIHTCCFVIENGEMHQSNGPKTNSSHNSAKCNDNPCLSFKKGQQFLFCYQKVVKLLECSTLIYRSSFVDVW